MSAQRLWDRGIAWAGLALGASAWTVNQLGGYAAVPWICAHRIYFTPFMALALAATALVGSLLSWRTWRAAPSGEHNGEGGTPAHLLAGMSALIGILFAILILTQGAAVFFLDGCER
jgi:hypothetical protein